MAVTAFSNGFSMTAAADTLPTGTHRIIKIHIVKQTNGTVQLKDSAGVVTLLTGVLSDTLGYDFDFASPWVADGLEYDAVSAGTAIVYVYTQS